MRLVQIPLYGTMHQLWKPQLSNLITIRDFLAVGANTYLFYSSFVLLLTIVIILVLQRIKPCNPEKKFV